MDEAATITRIPRADQALDTDVLFQPYRLGPIPICPIGCASARPSMPTIRRRTTAAARRDTQTIRLWHRIAANNRRPVSTSAGGEPRHLLSRAGACATAPANRRSLHQEEALT
jgi:hypothetical protein